MWQNARGVHRTPKTAKLQGPGLLSVPASLLLYSPECVEGAFSEVRIRHRAYLCSEKLEGLLHASVRTEPRPQHVGACIRICPIGQCAGQSPTPLRCVYATSRRLITPSESSRTVKDGAVVAIGVDQAESVATTAPLAPLPRSPGENHRLHLRSAASATNGDPILFSVGCEGFCHGSLSSWSWLAPPSYCALKGAFGGVLVSTF